MKEQIQSPSFIEINGQLLTRDQFGRGSFGERIWSTIVRGILCETIIDGGTKCGEPAIGTVDYDVIGEADSVYVCSEKHAQLSSNEILNDLHNQGRDSVLGRNGNGRENARIRY